MRYEMEQVSIRMVKEPPLISDRPITGPDSAVDIIGEYLGDFDRELMVLVNLRNDGKPINMNIMSIGKINASIACPREALKASILSNAASIMLFHNHPSGNLTPSREDIMTTDKMIKAYRLLDIQVLDHIIIGPDRQFYSMKARDILVDDPSFVCKTLRCIITAKGFIIRSNALMLQSRHSMRAFFLLRRLLRQDIIGYYPL